MKPSYLGDAVMATPMLDTLIREMGEVCVLAGPSVQEILRDRAQGLRFLDSGPEIGFWGPVRMARELRRLRPDAVFVLNRSLRSALGAWLGGVPVRVGHATEGRALLLTHPVPYDTSAPEMQCGLDLLRALGMQVPAASPSLTVTAEEREWACQVLGGAVVGLQPGARYAEKRLPAAVCAQLLRHWHRDGFRVAHMGGEEERAIADEVVDLAGVPVVDLVGRTAIREGMAVAANLRVVVGADTGYMHVAAAVGCPTVTVFGPNPASKWGHHHAPHCALQAPGGVMERLSADTLIDACDALVNSRLAQQTWLV